MDRRPFGRNRGPRGLRAQDGRIDDRERSCRLLARLHVSAGDLVQHRCFGNPDDTTWKKFPLTTPVTVDLSTALEGTLSSLTTGLDVPIGTYAQVRLIPVDSSATFSARHLSLGAIYNSEVDYTDSNGTAHQVPLELLNPDKGLGVTTRSR